MAKKPYTVFDLWTDDRRDFDTLEEAEAHLSKYHGAVPKQGERLDFMNRYVGDLDYYRGGIPVAMLHARGWAIPGWKRRLSENPAV